MSTDRAERLAFIDLAPQLERVRAGVEAGFKRVLDHGRFIMGPEVEALEEALAAFTRARSVITCSNGTDALWLAMLALGVGPGDAVFVPSWTFTATAEAPCLCGATPVFVDVDPEFFTMDPKSLRSAVEAVAAGGTFTPRAVIAVDLFGMVAPYAQIGAVAREHGMGVVADAAQAFGASAGGRRVGCLADITATSFFPAKPLGGFGDGGAVFTDDAALADRLRSLRAHGAGSTKDESARVGTNARLDTLQAVVLLEKLKIFEEELERRQKIAERYAGGLATLDDRVVVPRAPGETTSAWSQYTIKVDHRDALAERLQAEGVPTRVYYRTPIHMRSVYADFPTSPGGLPVTERLKDQVLSLPMYPYLSEGHQRRVIEAVRSVDALAGGDS